MTNHYYKLFCAYFKLHAHDIRREKTIAFYLDEINNKTKDDLTELARLVIIKEYPAFADTIIVIGVTMNK